MGGGGGAGAHAVRTLKRKLREDERLRGGRDVEGRRFVNWWVRGGGASGVRKKRMRIDPASSYRQSGGRRRIRGGGDTPGSGSGGGRAGLDEYVFNESDPKKPIDTGTGKYEFRLPSKWDYAIYCFIHNKYQTEKSMNDILKAYGYQMMLSVRKWTIQRDKHIEKSGGGGQPNYTKFINRKENTEAFKELHQQFKDEYYPGKMIPADDVLNLSLPRLPIGVDNNILKFDIPTKQEYTQQRARMTRLSEEYFEKEYVSRQGQAKGEYERILLKRGKVNNARQAKSSSKIKIKSNHEVDPSDERTEYAKWWWALAPRLLPDNYVKHAPSLSKRKAGDVSGNAGSTTTRKSTSSRSGSASGSASVENVKGNDDETSDGPSTETTSAQKQYTFAIPTEHDYVDYYFLNRDKSKDIPQIYPSSTRDNILKEYHTKLGKAVDTWTNTKSGTLDTFLAKYHVGADIKPGDPYWEVLPKLPMGVDQEAEMFQIPTIVDYARDRLVNNTGLTQKDLETEYNTKIDMARELGYEDNPTGCKFRDDRLPRKNMHQHWVVPYACKWWAYAPRLIPEDFKPKPSESVDMSDQIDSEGFESVEEDDVDDDPGTPSTKSKVPGGNKSVGTGDSEPTNPAQSLGDTDPRSSESDEPPSDGANPELVIDTNKGPVQWPTSIVKARVADHVLPISSYSPGEDDEGEYDTGIDPAIPWGFLDF